MMTSTIRTLLSLLVVALLATTAAFAEKNADGGNKGKRFEKIAQELSLTPEQQSQIQAIFQSHRAAMRAKHEAFETYLRSILTPEQIAILDRAKAERKDGQGPGHGGRKAIFKDLNLSEEQKSKLKAYRQENMPAMKADREKLQAEIAQVLTPEQKAKWEQMKSQRRDGKGRPGGPEQDQK